MTDEPLVSVVLPVYNSGAALDACVTSILEQTYTTIEVILVDDGSTDGSAEVCDRFAAVDPRVLTIHRANGGIAAAQNAGLDAATGSLVTFCDHDDLMSKHMIRRLVEILTATDSDMSCCRWHNVGASTAQALRATNDARPVSGRYITLAEPGRSYQEIFSAFVRRVSRAELRYFSEANWGKLYRRELFDGIRFPDGRYAQDVSVAMDLYGRMRRVASCDDALYYWVQHPGSVSHRLRSATYYHDIVMAHARSFEGALADGILPARASFGLTALRFEKRAVSTEREREMYLDDARRVRSLRARLSILQRLQCAVLGVVRRLEVIVYDATIHRRS